LPLDPEAAHQQARDTTGLVQQLADGVRRFGETVGSRRSGFDSLAVAVDELAALARTASGSIEQCLILARACPRQGDGPDLTVALYKLAVKWTASLDHVLDAAVAIYGQACSQLADRIAVAEEHLQDSPASGAQHLSAASLVQHARALEQSVATSRVI
jgi:hypothetical protein